MTRRMLAPVMALVLAFVVAPTAHAATPVAGRSCSKAGATARTVTHTTTATITRTLVCTRKGAKLVWVLRKAVTTPRPKPTPQPSATLTPSPTPTPTPTPSVTPTPSAAPTRATADQPDGATGYQLHAVYVVPADGTDRHLDTDGTLAGILTAGNALLQANIAHTARIDSTTAGTYDITYLHTTETTAQLETSATLTRDLLTELAPFDAPSPNRKDWLFFLDVPSVSGGTEACGYADEPGISAVIALQGHCGAAAFGLSDVAASTWVHEWFHNLGVGHTQGNPCDLMAAVLSCPARQAVTIDASHVAYVGATLFGVDVTSLPVWADPTPGAAPLDCALTPAARTGTTTPFAYCSTGTQRIGALTYCVSPFSAMTLQDDVNGQWVDVAPATASATPWGSSAWACSSSGFLAPTARVTQATPGLHHYRWQSAYPARTLEQLDVIWVA